MKQFNFSKAKEVAEKEHNIGGAQHLKLQEGQNRIRLVSECIPHEGEYNGKPTFKWLCQVIDRKDGKVKPFFMPHKIFKDIEALQMSEDYSFDAVPMPYDITITAIGAGMITVQYSTTPARQNTPITEDEQMMINGVPNINELQKKIREIVLTRIRIS